MQRWVCLVSKCWVLVIKAQTLKAFHQELTRDGVCNPVTHVLKAIETFKRFSRGCKPRPASSAQNNKNAALGMFSVEVLGFGD